LDKEFSQSWSHRETWGKSCMVRFDDRSSREKVNHGGGAGGVKECVQDAGWGQQGMECWLV